MMNRERLLKMAEFLEALPAHKFYFGSYVKVGDKLPAEALAAPEEHCGTTACAIGWMPAVFPDAFEWRKVASVWDSTVLPWPKGSEPDDAVSWGYAAEDRIKTFLELTNAEYRFLFIPNDSPLDDNAMAAEVATQIREFVSTEGANQRQWEAAQ